MAVYWLTFRLENDRTYQARYDALIEGVRLITDTTWWTEPTSFLLFQSPEVLDYVAGTVAAHLGPNDMALIGMPEVKAARLLGECQDQDLFKLMPFTKKL